MDSKWVSQGLHSRLSRVQYLDGLNPSSKESKTSNGTFVSRIHYVGKSR